MALNIRNINKEDFFKQASNREKIKFLLKYATLAPSILNSEPWLFGVGENKCTLYRDSKIQLREVDPVGRNIYLSLGCALENLVIASKYFGVFEKVENASETEKSAVAEIFFTFKDNPILDREYEKLVDFIPRRQNAIGIFKNETIHADLLSRLSMFSLLTGFKGLRIDFITNKEQILSLGRLTSDGIKLLWSSQVARKEVAGQTGSNLPSFVSKLLQFLNIGPLVARLNFKSFKSAPAVCVIGGADDKQETWIKTGQLTERLLLEFAARGIDASIFTAALKTGELYKEVQKIVGMTERPQIIFCLGHISKKHPFTPRHDINYKIAPNA